MPFRTLSARTALLLLFFLFLQHPLMPAPRPEWAQIESVNFRIFYPRTMQVSAVKTAELAENLNRRTARFMNYSLQNKLNIYLLSLNAAGVEGTKSRIEHAGTANIFIYSDLPESLKASELAEALAGKYLSAMTSELSWSAFRSSNQADRWLARAVSRQITASDSVMNEIIAGDYILNRKKPFMSLDEITGRNDLYAAPLQACLISFVLESYGNRKTSFILKNTAYYGGFSESLKKVTGKNAKTLAGEFTAFMKLKFGSPSARPDRKWNLKSSGDGQILSMDIDSEGSRTLLLRNRWTGFNIVLQEGPRQKSLLSFPSDMKSLNRYAKVCFLNSKTAAAALPEKGGSIIKLMDLDKGKIIKTFPLPYFYITALRPYGKSGSLLFSAENGTGEDIFIYDAVQNSLKKITSGTYQNTYPDSGKSGIVYYIEKSDACSIVQYDLYRNTTRLLFKVQAPLRDLRYNKNELFFSMKSGGIFNIHALNLNNNSVRRVSSARAGACRPLLSGEQVIYQSISRGRTSFFTSDISADHGYTGPGREDANIEDIKKFNSILREGDDSPSVKKMSSFSLASAVNGNGEDAVTAELIMFNGRLNAGTLLTDENRDFDLSFEIMFPSFGIIPAYRHRENLLISDIFSLFNYRLNSGIERGKNDLFSLGIAFYPAGTFELMISGGLLRERDEDAISGEDFLSYQQASVSAEWQDMAFRGFLPDSGYFFRAAGEYNRCITDNEFSYILSSFEGEAAYTWQNILSFNAGVSSILYSGGDDDFHRAYSSGGGIYPSGRSEYLSGEKTASFNTEMSLLLFDRMPDRPFAGLKSTMALALFYRGAVSDRMDEIKGRDNLSTAGGALKIQFYPLIFLRLDYMRRLYEHSESENELALTANILYRW